MCDTATDAVADGDVVLTIKVAWNAWVAPANAAIAHSVRLTKAAGLDPRQFLEAI